MADIVFKYTEMQQCVDNIKEIAVKYRAAATTLQSDFESAINGWEGDTRDKMQQFMGGAVREFTEQNVPGLVDGLAALLQANIDQMKKADQTLAENIPTTLS